MTYDIFLCNDETGELIRVNAQRNLSKNQANKTLDCLNDDKSASNSVLEQFGWVRKVLPSSTLVCFGTTIPLPTNEF